MATVFLPADLRRYTGDMAEVEVSAINYRDLVMELCRRFPALTEEVIGKQAIAIDGMIIHRPFLEAFGSDSELVFIARIAGG